eukprot:5512701-Prymnesium_polylepis.1
MNRDLSHNGRVALPRQDASAMVQCPTPGLGDGQRLRTRRYGHIRGRRACQTVTRHRPTDFSKHDAHISRA